MAGHDWNTTRTKRSFAAEGQRGRTILLANCFNIAKKEDVKYKNVFALYTSEDVFGLIADSEEELTSWLQLFAGRTRQVGTTPQTMVRDMVDQGYLGVFVFTFEDSF